MSDHEFDRKYPIECEQGHSRELTPSQLELLMESGEHNCKKCSLPLVFADRQGVDLECQICSDVFHVSSLQEGMYTLDDGCRICQDERGFSSDSVHVPGSFGHHMSEYKWVRNGKDAEPVRRVGRTDYWEAVAHFCTAEEFAGIAKAGRIKAATTGYFKQPAVCLTETPAGHWSELRRVHGDFGYLFRKRDIIHAGGGPALYMLKVLIRQQQGKGFAPEVKPFVNLLRLRSPAERRHDFLHEREWRVPSDIELKKLKPYAVVLGKFSSKTKGWKHIFAAAHCYDELMVED